MNKIKPKRSYTSNSVPLTTDLEVNELAIRWASDSPAIFTKNAAGQIVTVALGGSSGGGGSSSLVTAATVAGFPATGSTANIYVATDTNRIYRWDSANSIYVELGPLASSGDTLLRSYLVPTAPTGVTATAGNAQVALSWTAASSLSQIPIADYLIQSSTDNGATWTLASDTVSTATSATISGLTNGQSYRWRVAAVNGVGTGAYSTASSAVTPAAELTVEYLVVAGGGGGGNIGGGGGAGGFRTGSLVGVTLGTPLTVTVGAGGAGSTAGAASVFDSISAAGGGRGGDVNSNTAGSGGSGGGAGRSSAAGTLPGGSGNSPSTSPAQGNAGGSSGAQAEAYAAGGGGGAGAAGQNGNSTGSVGTTKSGDGGAGASSSITGASVTYAGGGGGAAGSGSLAGAGGAGGGGAGGEGVAGVAGTANTGGGGGGGGGGAGASGGSGVVIIRANTTAASTTGSPTVTTVGGDTVYTFTGSGSITF